MKQCSLAKQKKAAQDAYKPIYNFQSKFTLGNNNAFCPLSCLLNVFSQSPLLAKNAFGKNASTWYRQRSTHKFGDSLLVFFNFLE